MRPKTCSFSPPGFSLSVMERANKKQTAENCEGMVVKVTSIVSDKSRGWSRKLSGKNNYLKRKLQHLLL